MTAAPRYIWAPQPGPQHALIDCPLPLVFFGGARGGGKSDGMLGKWAIDAQKYGRHFNAIMFRRTTVSSEDAIERSRQIYGPLGGRFTATPLPTWRMPGGGRVSFRYLDRTADADEYQGRNVTHVWVEEAGQYPDPTVIDRMFGVMRSSSGVPVQMVLTGNPGGPGQGWLRERFGLHPFPARPRGIRVRIGEGQIDAAVIPSRITDNRALLDADPGYLDRLKMVGSSQLVRAWLDGDWSAIEGAFFADWSEARHVVPWFEPPRDWMRFRALDWGYARPFAVQWWAVVGDGGVYHGRYLPRGALICYREWYGASAPNVGLKLTAEEVADGVREREADETISYGVADPAIAQHTSGPSIAERMAVRGVMWRPADNTRIGNGRGHMGGWDLVRARLRGNGALPMLYAMDTARDLIRTLPMMQHDRDRPEDMDTEGEDHAADTLRYACSSRPWVPASETAPKPQPPGTVYIGPPPESDAGIRRTRL